MIIKIVLYFIKGAARTIFYSSLRGGLSRRGSPQLYTPSVPRLHGLPRFARNDEMGIWAIISLVYDMLKKLIFLLSLLLSASLSQAKSTERSLIAHLPDGTEIKIENDQAYYNCKGKITLLPDGDYLLADGCELSIKNQKITELTQ